MHFLNKNNILDIKNITPCYRWGSILLLFFLCTKNIYAQDSQLSQYYASPLYLNPALVGTSNNGRAFFNYRNQWVNIPSDFATYVFGMDTPLPNKHISIGAQVVKDFIVQNNKSIYNKTIANLTSGYKFNLNRQYVVSFGLQIGFEQLDLNSSSLIFGDQINDNGITSNNTKEKLDRSTSFSPDISAGGTIYSNKLWFGVAFYHINQPTTTRNKANKNIIPMRFSMQSGYRIPLSYRWHNSVANYDDKFLTLMLHYQSQRKNDQLSLGINLDYNPILFGIWYRGLLMKENMNSGQPNHDAIIFKSGVRVKRIVLGYSFDLPIGGLTFSEGNSHEISLQYAFNLFPNHDRNKRQRWKNKFMTDKCPAPII